MVAYVDASRTRRHYKKRHIVIGWRRLRLRRQRMGVYAESRVSRYAYVRTFFFLLIDHWLILNLAATGMCNVHVIAEWVSIY